MTTPQDKIEGHLNNPSGQTIVMAVELRDRLQKRASDAEMRAEDLRRELEAERALTPDARLTDAGALIEALKGIADHAVANLAPEFIKDLPAELFLVAADLVGHVIGATQRDEERATVWADRAKLILEWRDKRKSRGWDDAPPAPQARILTSAETKRQDLRDLKEMAKALGYGIVKLVMPKAGKPAKGKVRRR